ncbi:MAG: DUF424 family protein [Nanoarchaeota archaeon]|nr:DUF424 family protein [Nanoarchaeota archaeon]
MIIKIHKSQEGKTLIAICDSDLIGKKFEKDNKQLDLTSNFYQGEEKDENECLEIIKCANILNIVGEKSIEFALKNNLITKENIMKIAGIPIAQPYLSDD